jgi:hypothetical protein
MSGASFEGALGSKNFYADRFAIFRQVYHHVLGRVDALPIFAIHQPGCENVLVLIVTLRRRSRARRHQLVVHNVRVNTTQDMYTIAPVII